ncbi:hypothetical protein ACFX1X_026408 [Malus domestica]
MSFEVSDELLAIFIPILVYWIYAGVLHFMEFRFPKFKIPAVKESQDKNLVSQPTVIVGVLLQQFGQATIAGLMFWLTGQTTQGHAAATLMMLLRAGVQFFFAMLVLDTWQYFMHRCMHENKVLYKYIHSRHHRLVAPYAYGALYNHPIEGLIVDTMSGAVSFLASGMSPRMSIFFFSLATVKAVDDHCGMWIPWHPFHLVFRNNSHYHTIHHSLHGTKHNYSQPFFVFWDRIFGTYYVPRGDEEEEKNI